VYLYFTHGIYTIYGLNIKKKIRNFLICIIIIMSTNIDDAVYSPLNTYAILAGSGITTVNKTTIPNGFVYGSSPTPTYRGTFVGLPPDSANALLSQTQLTNLVNAIQAVAVTDTIVGAIGTVTYTPGRHNSSTIIIYASATNIILDALGNNNAQFFFTAGTSITFASISSITLINGASNCNVFWLAGSSISFTGTSPPSIPGIFIAGTAITFDNASRVFGRLYAQTANVTFVGTSSVNGNCDIVCYVKGTLILTKNGFVPIENIKPGDKLLTKGKIHKDKFVNNRTLLKIRPVTWISKFKVINLDAASRPICIKQNAFGNAYPFKDLYVSPCHRLLLNDRMVLAKNIVNGKTIYQDNECNNIEYYHVECKHHVAIFANGLLAESYLDSNNRHVFENSVKSTCV